LAANQDETRWIERDLTSYEQEVIEGERVNPALIDQSAEAQDLRGGDSEVGPSHDLNVHTSRNESEGRLHLLPVAN